MWIVIILIYLLGMVPTYLLVAETQHTMFNKIWFTIFWPSVVLIYLIALLKKKK